MEIEFTNIHIRNGRVIDPAAKYDQMRDLFIHDGRVVESLPTDAKNVSVIDATNCVVSPGFTDIHVHFRDPGQTHKEDFSTGSRAAASGGVTTVVCMPNTNPAFDNAATIEIAKQKAERDAAINVYFSGTLTVGRKGQQLANIASLKRVGVVGLTDDGDCIQSNELMRKALEYAKAFDLPVFDHCQDASLTQNGVMNEGRWSTKLGLKGWPSAAEDIIVSRNIILSAYTGAHVHMQHLSSANSVNLLRQAKKQGIRVSAEVTPHHLALTDATVASYDTAFKMNPPLRTETDRLALIEGLLDGTIDVIATDHAPHADFEKDVEFDKAPFGIIGLQTMLPISLQIFYQSKLADLSFIISRLSQQPAALLGLPVPSLTPGSSANVTIFNPNEEWVYNKSNNHSRSHNSPWLNQTLQGKVKWTILNKKIVYCSE